MSIGERHGARRIARHTLFNVIGESAPIIAAVFAIPLLIHGLGTARFGVLTLIWMVVGYFSLFDLGLGRALTKVVAENLGAGRDERVPTLVWTALLCMLLLGAIGTAVVAGVSPLLARRVLKMPDALRPESLRAFYVLALSIPIVIVSTGVRGVLEAIHRFDLTNAVRTPMGVFNFLAPLLVLPFSRSLVPVVWVLVGGRFLTCSLYFALCLRVFPALRQSVWVQLSAVRPLFLFGSWMTISNIVSPIMTTLDRFIIGALVSAHAVAYYATPYDVAAKMLVIPTALVTVLFPTFSAEIAQDRGRVTGIFRRAVKYIFLALFPLTLTTVALAHVALQLWLGPEFAEHSTRVLQWLAVGILLNSLAFVPFALIQSAGRPDVTAKLHLLELPLYLVTLYGLVTFHGIEGAAVASVLRIAVDTATLFLIAWRFLHFRVRAGHLIGVGSAAALASIGVAAMPGTYLRVVTLVLVLAIFSVFAWCRLLVPQERALLMSYVRTSRAGTDAV